MKKPFVIIIIFAVVILGGGGILLAKHNSNSNKNADNSSNMSNMSSSQGRGGSGEGDGGGSVSTNQVNIKDLAFSPANITITKGTAVTWTNNDSTTHTVTETDGQTGPDNNGVAPGKSYSFTFNTVGTFKYHCAIHSEMTGTVIVTE